MFTLPPVPELWQQYLAIEYNKPYMQNLQTFLQREKKPFYPPPNLIFNALHITPLQNVKVVILGQDPYHNVGQAMGLSFSVPLGIKLPPSLKNIYQEVTQDTALAMPAHGDLTKWAQQGVLLLNTVLTVSANSPASHANKGWENFTDKIIEIINIYTENTVFILWGNHAIRKKSLLTAKKHCILSSPHPSPFSAHSGFFGCKHFSQTNAYLLKHNREPIVWNRL